MRFVELSELRKDDELKIGDLVYIKDFSEFMKLAEKKPVDSSLIYMLGNFDEDSVKNVTFALVDKYSDQSFEKIQGKYRDFLEKELDYVPEDSKPGKITQVKEDE